MTFEKRCPTCTKDLPVENFHLNKAKKDGLAVSCKACQREASRKHYRANKQAYLDRNQKQRRKVRIKLFERKKDMPCTDCGGIFHPFIMEFDHIDPSTKTFSVSRAGCRSEKRINEEIAKCEPVCANCHKMRTFRRKQQDSRHVLIGVK